ncbi:MAG: thioredoxin family protein [Proteobacteria bacterium]|nr:thioredoxin family protein [Pseudomonadota bacterium]
MYGLKRVVLVAAAIVVLAGVGLTSVFAADLDVSGRAGPADAPDSLWVAVRPAGDQPFTFWAAGQNGPGINWTLPPGATLGETLWPKLHLLGAGADPVLAFAGDAVILQEINALPAGLTAQIAVTMSYAVCAPDTGFCAAAEANGQLEPDGQPGDADLFASARMAAAPFRRAGIMARAGGGQFAMGLNKMRNKDASVARAFFLPFTRGLLASEGVLELQPFETGFFSTVDGGPALEGGAGEGISEISGLLVLLNSDAATGNQATETYLLREPNDFAKAGAAADPVAYGDNLSLVRAILFAVLGGMILNLMPCVFPILAMKVFALVRAASESQQALRREAWIYTAGVMVSFLALAGLLIFIRGLGQQVGWGFQLQSPVFIFFISIVLFLVGLNLLGVFQMGNMLQNLGGKLAMRGAKEGPAGAFMTGVLATLVATPCTVPFMAPAIGFALTQSAAASLGIFAGLGLGLALPYLALAYIPAIQRRFPAPGPWMVSFKEFLAFPMFATVVWLVWILETQSGALGVIMVLGALVLTGLGLWLVRLLKDSAAPLRRGVAVVMIVAVLAPMVVQGALPQVPRGGVQTQFSPDLGIHSEVYSEARLHQLRTAGQPVFLHFWASWCIICLMHENLVYSTDEFQAFLRDNNVVFMEIDNTLEDPETIRMMERFGRSGQPLDIFFPGDIGAPAYVLPELYTTGKVLALMEPRL